MKNIVTLLLTIGSLSMFAQTGPGGVGNSSTNVIWLDGNLVTTATYPNISTWPDQSGNGNDFSQSTDSKRPSVVTYSGFNGLRFDGADWLRTSAITALNANSNTQYIIYNGYRPNHVGVLFESSYTQSNQFIRTTRQNGNVRPWVLNSTGSVIDNKSAQSSAFQIISSVWNGNTQNYSSYKDGTLFGSKTGANGNPTGNYLNTIGAASNNSYRFDGDIGEIIIYNTALNSAQRNIIDNYLSSKFNISISNDLYSYESTHKHQLIGIGSEADGNNLTAQGKGIVELSSGSMSNGDYVIVAHNNTNLATTTNDVPVSLLGGSRLSRSWRADITGSPSNLTITFDVSSLTLPTGSYYLLVESANGIFNDGGVVEYGPFADVAGIVSFSDITLNDGDYFTIATGTNTGIASIKTGNWSSSSTWNCGCIPGATDDVTISLGHTVTAKSSTNVNNLTIDGNLNTQETGVFNIKGNLLINATGRIYNKTITFNGTSAQTLQNNSATPVSFNTLIINNSNGVNVQSGSFIITNSLQVPNGPLNNVAGSFTMSSTASSTAIIINSAGGLSGNFIIQRYISQRNGSWGDLSSPVSNATLGDWDSDPTNTINEIYMSGVNGLNGDAAGWNSVYYYDENSQAYVAITDTNYALTAGKGIELLLEDSNTTFYSKTFDTRGTPNFGDIPVAVSNSWNLIGNPYASWINWNSISKPTLNGTFYIWNTNNGNYEPASSGSIAPHQGFWVESNGSGTVTFSESSKAGSGSSSFYKNSIQLDTEPNNFSEAALKLISLENNYNQSLKLRINNLASVNHDNYDATYLPSRLSEAPAIYSYSANNNKKLIINSFDYNSEVILPVAIEVGVSGKYVIEAIDFENLTSQYAVIELTDTKTGKVYQLSHQKTIELSLDETDNGERFSLKLSNQSTANATGSLSNVNIYKSNETTVIELGDATQQYTISVYNALGQKILNDQQISNSNKVELQNNLLNKGLIIIKVSSNHGEFVKKLTY